MSRRQLNDEMDARELMNWMAYEMSIDPDKNKEYMKQIEAERAAFRTLEDEARDIKQLFASIGK